MTEYSHSSAQKSQKIYLWGWGKGAQIFLFAPGEFGSRYGPAHFSSYINA